MDYGMYMEFKAIYEEERGKSIYTGFLSPGYFCSPRIETLLNNVTGHELMILSKTTINSTKKDILEYIQILQRIVETIPDVTFPWNTPTPTNNNPRYGQNRQYQPLNQTADNMSNELCYPTNEEPKVISDSVAKKLKNELDNKMNVNPSEDDYLLNTNPIKRSDMCGIMYTSTPDNLDSQTGREPEHKSDTVEHDNTSRPDYSETQKILSAKQILSTTNTVNGRNPWGVQCNQNNQTVKIGIDDSGKNVVLPNPECGNILTANIPNTPQISEIVESNIPTLSPFKQIGSPGNLLDILNLNENE